MASVFRSVLALCASGLLAACVAVPQSAPAPPPRNPGPVTTTPPTRPPAPVQVFRGAEIMRERGLDQVIRANARSLQAQFGTPQLDVREGDARKLQFAGAPCVLDVFLYPLTDGGEQVATWVEARRASDGAPVDRAACVAALRR